ncbi:hypothetical protein LTR94_028329, partial [Friedmanniomyces endolithicus]
EEDTLAIMRDEMGKGAYSGVIHCFTASDAFADIALDLGLYISISGIVTFRNAAALQATAARLPRERLLIETDAPFLAPVPHRGKTGEPAFVADTAAFLATLRGEDIRLLGSGTSSGVPRIGNDWGACDPAEPRNRRTRSSALVEHDGTRILIDTSPDMREQLLAAGVDRVDAVIWTHAHADHIFGIDDLRQVYHAMARPVIGYARSSTEARLRAQFGYVFEGNGGYPPTVSLMTLPDALRIGGIDIRVADQPHGGITSAGLRFEAGGVSIGYATDISDMTEDMRALYQDLD